MKNLKIFAAIIPLFAVGVALTPNLRADYWDKLTKVTFNAPVEIPGQVLPAGTYWFKLLDAKTDRNIVQIFNKNDTKQVAMVMAIPDSRARRPAQSTIITFEERSSSAPPAIKAWFFPGDSYGNEFVYPKTRAVALAKAANAPVPAMPQNLEANNTMTPKSPRDQSVTQMRQAQVQEEEPNGNEAPLSQDITTPPDLAQNNPPANSAPAPASQAPATSQTQPSTLPQTASDLPLFALIGMFLTGAGFAVRSGVKRLS